MRIVKIIDKDEDRKAVYGSVSKEAIRKIEEILKEDKNEFSDDDEGL